MKRIMLVFLLALSSEVLFAVPETSKEYLDKAIEAYNKNQNKKAFDLFTLAKNAGEADAIAYLADMYEKGYAVKKDLYKSKELLLKGIEKGSVLCMNDLGNLYFSGKLGEANYSEAEKYFLMAAMRGNATAQRNMGLIYEIGNIAVRDYHKAALWYKVATLNGSNSASNDYINMMDKGYSVSEEEARAFIRNGYSMTQSSGNPYSEKPDSGTKQQSVATEDGAFFFFQIPWAKSGVSTYEKAKLELILNGEIVLIEGQNTCVRVKPGKLNIVFRYAAWGKDFHPDNTLSVVNNVKPGETLYYTFTGLGTLRPMNEKERAKARTAAPEIKSLVKSEPTKQVAGDIPATVPVKQEETVTVSISAVDSSIPNTNKVSDNTFAVIIANENYTSVSKVDYARNDGKIFSQYCHRTLGIPENHILFKEDATFGAMESVLSRIEKIGAAYDGDLNIIFYYAGHGIPDEKTKDSFLIPIDGDGSMKTTCIKTSTVYKRLSDIKAKSVVVFMDACFSGSARGDAMLASARGVRIAPKEDIISGKIVVFTASHGDETAYPYKEQGHGLFTYYLLKKIQETSGNVKLGEMMDYVQSSVKKESIVNCGQIQTPAVLSSRESSDWRNWTL